MKIKLSALDFTDGSEQAYLEKLSAKDASFFKWNQFYIYEKESNVLIHSLNKYKEQISEHAIDLPTILIFNTKTPSLFQKRTQYNLILVSTLKPNHLFHELIHLFYQSLFPFLEEGFAGYMEMIGGEDDDGVSLYNILDILKKNKDSYLPISILIRETTDNLHYFLPENYGGFNLKFAYYESVAFANFVIERYSLEFYISLLKNKNPFSYFQIILKKDLDSIIAEFETLLGITLNENKEKTKIAYTQELFGSNSKEEKRLVEIMYYLDKEININLTIDLAEYYLICCYQLSNIYEKDENVYKENSITRKYMSLIKNISKEDIKITGDLVWLIPELTSRRIRFEPYAIRFKMAKNIEKMYGKALKKEKVLFRVYLSYGRYRMFSPSIIGGNINEAINYFKKAVKKRPSDETYAWLALAYQKKGELEKAYHAAICSTNINSENVIARNILKKINLDKKLQL